MDLSLYLCRFFGCYLFIMMVFELLNKRVMEQVAHEYFSQVTLRLVSGVFTTILGLFLILSHNLLEWTWRGTITVLCAVVLLKGVLVLFAPRLMKKATDHFLKASVYYTTDLICLLLALYLLYVGFIVTHP